MNFKSGDIIKYAGEFYEVIDNEGHSGTVWELNTYLERTGLRIENFKWEAYGEVCTRVKAMKDVLLSE